MTELAGIGRLERSRRRLERFGTPVLVVENVLTIAILGLAIDRSTDQPAGVAWLFCAALLGAVILWWGTYLWVLRIKRRLGTMVLLRCQASSRNQIGMLTLPLIAHGFINEPVKVDVSLDVMDGAALDASKLARQLLDQHLAIAAADDPRTGTCLLIDLEWFVAFALGIEASRRLSTTDPNDRHRAELARSILWTRNPGTPGQPGRPEDLGRLDELLRSFGSSDPDTPPRLGDHDASVGFKVEISGTFNPLPPTRCEWQAATAWPVNEALQSADIIRVADNVGATIARAAAATSGEVHVAMRTENTNAFLTGMACWGHLDALGLGGSDVLERFRLWRYQGETPDRPALLSDRLMGR